MILDEFSAYLMPGEHMMWSGEPRQGFVFTSGDVFMIPFSLLWGGFAVFWESSVISGGAPLFFMLWGVPFVLVGLYITVGRFFVDAWIRRRTAYVLTDRRVLIVRAGPFANTTSLSLATLFNVQLNETSNGRGTIQFGDSLYSRFRGFGSWSPGLDPTPKFFAIAGARGVFNQVQAAQARLRPSAAAN